MPTDWSAYDAAMTPYMNGSYWSDGVPSARLTAPFTPGANWGPEAQCTQAQYTALAAAWAAHLKAKGWFNKAIVYALDEPDPSSYPAIIKNSLWMQNGDPAWKSHIMDTTPARASTAGELNPALGIYTVAIPGIRYLVAAGLRSRMAAPSGPRCGRRASSSGSTRRMVTGHPIPPSPPIPSWAWSRRC